jgi:tetratricopeptide (TPR) repeat protein
MSSWREIHDSAYACAQAGNLDEAERQFKTAIACAEINETSSQLASSINCLAFILQVQGREEEAESFYRRTIELEPPSIDMPNACEALADLLMEEELFEDALALYERAVEECRNRNLLLPWSVEAEKLISVMTGLGLADRLGERDLDTAQIEEIVRQKESALELLGNELSFSAGISLDNAKIISAIESFVDRLQDEFLSQELTCSISLPVHSDSQAKSLSSSSEHESWVLSLGSLWGELIIAELNWRWVCFANAGNSIALVSQNRSQLILPYHFLRACFEEPQLDCTIKLAFEMLKKERSHREKGCDDEYDNYMESVMRVVPKPGRTFSLSDARLLV